MNSLKNKMNKNKKLLALSICIYLMPMLSCSKNDLTSNNVKSPFTVMYELTSTSSLNRNGGGGVEYTNSAQGTSGIGSSVIGTLPWKTTLTVTAENRPLTFTYRVKTIELNNSGTITGNIYINGIKKASITEPSRQVNFKFYSDLNMQYVVE
jgi:hypothetical protein